MSTLDISSFVPARAAPRLYLQQTRANFERVPSLDGLRAASILIVMLSHYVDSRLFPGGFGVLVFFVVSGFLITRLLFAETRNSGRVSLTNFYLRRFFRLYPVVTIYAATVVLFFVLTSRPFDWIEPGSALFYFANYLYAWSSTSAHAGATTMPFGIFWSLSVEEHFYLFFPLLFVLVRGRALVSWMVAICLACLACRVVLAAMYPEWLTSHIFYFTDVRLDSIAFGVLLAAICETPRSTRTIALLEHPFSVAAAAAAIFLCLAIRDAWFRETLRYTILGASIAVLVAAVVFSPRYAFAQVVLNSAFVRWIGMLSYSLYVWHTFLPLLLRRFAPDLPESLRVAANFALALAVAALSYYAVEKPVASLRRRVGSRTTA
ncbi:MAG TPA: acyltransferase [Rhizomicrobium sp.]